MEKKKGISLIVLIITIIVIIILAAVVILTITKNNPVSSAKESAFKEDVRTFQDDLALTVAKEYTDKQGKRDTKINATGKDVKKYIQSFKDKYVNKFAIVDDNLVATDKVTENEKLWIEDLNLNSVEPEETNYTSEEIESSEYLYAIGKTKPEYVVAKFNNNYTEVVITKNGEESDGIIQLFAPWTISSPMSDRKDNLQKAIVKNGIIDLGDGSAGGGTFCNCTNLKSIILPNGLMYIKQNCFVGCKSITNISLPDSVTSIRQWAFSNCSSLTNITYKGTKEQWNNINKSIVDGKVNWCDSTLKTITCTDGVITL